MARKLSHTLIVEGELVASTPVHIGGAEQGLVSDMPLAVDGLGRFYLPGTSLGGAIRAFCCAAPDDRLWGFAQGDDLGTASRIVIDDAPAIDQQIAELWHGNGIDRSSGTAAKNIKYDQEVLPQGTRFSFRLSLEVETMECIDSRRGWLGHLVHALEAGRVPIGAGSTRGLGRIRMEATRCYEQNWSTPEGIFNLLDMAEATDTRSAWFELAKQSLALCTQSYVQITIHWQPSGPLMSKAAREGIVVDSVPFISRNEQGDFALTLPGAGIKGALRSHAERIVRTVADVHYPSNGKHFEQIDVPLAGDLFGRARAAESATGSGAPNRQKARLAVETCYADFALPTEQWDLLECDELSWRSTEKTRPLLSRAMHVAVDRWTGGAAESLLYSAIEPDQINWQPIVMHFDASSKPLAEFALLWLTLCDLCDGQIPLGYGVNRGYGSVRVNKIDISGLSLLLSEQEESPKELPVSDTGIKSDSIQPVLTLCEEAWQQWVGEQGARS